jgi:hypothetical protein
MNRLVWAAVGFMFVATLAGCGATSATTEPTSAVPSLATVVTPLGSGAGPVVSASPATAGGQARSSGLTFSGIAGTGPSGDDWVSPPFDLTDDIYYESWTVSLGCPGFDARLTPSEAGFTGGEGDFSGGGLLGALPTGTYQLRVRDQAAGLGVCSFTATLLGATANDTGNLGPWNVTIVADSQETRPGQFEASIPAGFTRHTLTLAVENVSGLLFPVEIGGVVRSSDGFVYPQSGASVVTLPPATDFASPPATGTAPIPAGFRVPVRLTIDVASNAHDPTVSLCRLAAGPPQAPAACGASRIEASLASVPSSGSVSFAAPGALRAGSTFAQGPLSLSVTGFAINCTDTGDTVTVRVKSAYGYPLQPNMNLEVFDPAGRLANAFLYFPEAGSRTQALAPVPPGGSLDVTATIPVGKGNGCRPAGTYIGVLQLPPLVADANASSTQALAGAQTYVFAMPHPSSMPPP